jgi:hypothetical protein
VPYGPTHDALPGFLLRSLAPAAPPTSDNANSIESIIPNTPTVGRLNEIARVVSAALDGRPCIITGAPGKNRGGRGL